MKILPKSSKTIFIYECPHCNFDIEVSSKIVTNIGKTACQICDEIITFEKLTINILSPQEKHREKPTINNGIQTDCLSMLENLGYKTKESQKMVQDYFHRNEPETIQQAIEGILACPA